MKYEDTRLTPGPRRLRIQNSKKGWANEQIAPPNYLR
jgi:hypothetical protein